MSRGGGGRAALAATYREDFQAIATYLLRRTGDRELAEELASQTFAEAFAKCETWRDKGLPIRCWLLRIATRKLARHARAERRGRAFRERAARGSAYERDAAGRSEDAALLRAAMSRLSREHQDVLALFHLAEMSVEGVASVLEARVGTVKSRLARGRDALRREIERFGKGPD